MIKSLRAAARLEQQDVRTGAESFAAAETTNSGGCGGGCSSGAHLNEGEKEARVLSSGVIELMNQLLPTTLSRDDVHQAFSAGPSSSGGGGKESEWTIKDILEVSSADDPEGELDYLVI